MKTLMLTVISLLLLTACGGTQHRQSKTPSQLVETADEYGYDTIALKKNDTLCNAVVDNVLRHYPEFYHATRNAKKAFEHWKKQEQIARLKTKPEIMDISHILDEMLNSNKKVSTESSWLSKSKIDSLYIQLIVNVPEKKEGVDIDSRKSEIGRSRKAWLTYIEQLQNITQTVPEGYAIRYQSIVAEKLNKHLKLLQTASNEQ